MTSLLARTPAADRQFERIYRKHLADVYRYTLAVLRNPQDAEDVTQTTFLNAYRAMQGGERPQVPKNWLIAIAHNVCRQRFRQAQRRPQETELFEDGAAAAVEERDEQYSAEDIRRALGYLAFNQRAALVMRELEGRNYDEIAGIMGLSHSAVETLIFRARRALREQLEGTLTCEDAEFLLSKQADDALSRAERGQLRAHLRECPECSSIGRSQRASRTALKVLLGGMPIPTSLGSLFGGGSTAGIAVATKAAAVVFAGAVVGGAGYEGARQAHILPTHAPARIQPAAAAPNLVAAQRNQVHAVSAPGLGRGQALTDKTAHGRSLTHTTATHTTAQPKAVESRGFVVPPGSTHVKLESHLKLTRGFAVPKGSAELKVTTTMKIVPAQRSVHAGVGAANARSSGAQPLHGKNAAP